MLCSNIEKMGRHYSQGVKNVDCICMMFLLESNYLVLLPKAIF